MGYHDEKIIADAPGNKVVQHTTWSGVKGEKEIRKLEIRHDMPPEKYHRVETLCKWLNGRKITIYVNRHKFIIQCFGVSPFVRRQYEEYINITIERIVVISQTIHSFHKDHLETYLTRKGAAYFNLPKAKVHAWEVIYPEP